VVCKADKSRVKENTATLTSLEASTYLTCRHGVNILLKVTFWLGLGLVFRYSVYLLPQYFHAVYMYIFVTALKRQVVKVIWYKATLPPPQTVQSYLPGGANVHPYQVHPTGTCTVPMLLLVESLWVYITDCWTCPPCPGPARFLPQNCPSHTGIWTLMVPWTSQYPKQHHGLFSSLCRALSRARQTDRPHYFSL